MVAGQKWTEITCDRLSRGQVKMGGRKLALGDREGGADCTGGEAGRAKGRRNHRDKSRGLASAVDIDALCTQTLVAKTGEKSGEQLLDLKRKRGETLSRPY